MTSIILLCSILIGCTGDETLQPNDTLPPIEDNQEVVDMEYYINSIGMKFALIPSGEFMMGADDSGAYSCEKPQHRVEISNSFYMGVYEVTQAQWEEIMGFNPYDLDHSNLYYNLPGMAERITRPNHPATVSWEDAQEFITALNNKEGHNRYRLPTEAEWEYAARANTQTLYSFGNNVSELSNYAWYGEDFASGGTHPVGEKLPNAWGLYDMHGNAWEWVEDWYSESYYAQSPATDPKGADSGSHRSVRGGSWHQTATSWRVSYRKPYAPNYRGISIGFRVVLEKEQT